ncbi:substrate-binding domain-containing protein [Yersinia massiliensis]|uniref:substrate-binding domain-containing protein n=1 Tax=Yersinia massiliensis TaxID=419257 RepID=UPI00119D9D29|nr:substrate-binding domain-containing protein [Yersinia massiliensis]
MMNSDMDNSGQAAVNVLKVICSMATSRLLQELILAYTKLTGTQVRLESTGGVTAVQRVAAGEKFDIVILALPAITRLATSVQFSPPANIALSKMALAVHEDHPTPDINNEEALRTVLLGAKSIGCSTGPSGDHLKQILTRWGQETQLGQKLVVAPPGISVGSLIASGKVDIGFQQLSELLPLLGIKILENLPPEVQLTTCFAGAIPEYSEDATAAKALLQFLVSPEADDIKIQHGMTPSE